MIVLKTPNAALSMFILIGACALFSSITGIVIKRKSRTIASLFVLAVSLLMIKVIYPQAAFNKMTVYLLAGLVIFIIYACTTIAGIRKERSEL
jgi:uncharacterized membrane protein YobD (UPF0266 family)